GQAARAAPEAALCRFRPGNRAPLRREDPPHLGDRGRSRLSRSRGAGDRRADCAGRRGARHRRRLGAARGKPQAPGGTRHGGLSAGEPRGTLPARALRPRPAAARDRRSARAPARALRRARRSVSRRRRPGARDRVPERAGAGARAAGKAGRAMESLRVALGERSYPIHIGTGILDATALYAPHLPAGSAAVVTNELVAPLYLARVRKALEAAGARVAQIVLEDGEQAKRWTSLERAF